jgi:hypothetical protein
LQLPVIHYLLSSKGMKDTHFIQLLSCWFSFSENVISTRNFGLIDGRVQVV